MSPLFYYKQKKMGIAIYVCITVVRHNIIKSALQTIFDQQSARSTSSILNCSEASLGYRPLFTGGLCDFFFCFVQFLQTDHFVLGILQSQMGVCVHGNSDVRMAHQVLQGLWIHAGAGHIAAVGVAADIQIMKDYMASGSFARGKEEKAARASMVFVGNINQSVDVLLKTSSLFDPFPPEMGTDTAFLDRIC